VPFNRDYFPPFLFLVDTRCAFCEVRTEFFKCVEYIFEFKAANVDFY
jgi:hypothetical protein